MSGEECTLSQITDERNTGTTISHKRSVIGYQSPKPKETVNVWTLIPLSSYCHLVFKEFISFYFNLPPLKNKYTSHMFAKIWIFLKFRINKLINSKRNYLEPQVHGKTEKCKYNKVPHITSIGVTSLVQTEPP